GAPSSNTAPSTSIESSNTRILRVGVDSLYLSYPGLISQETHIRLQTLKQQAQSDLLASQMLAQYENNGHIFEVRDRGRHPFLYILSDQWFRIEVAGPNATRVPLAHIKIASELLTLKGHVATENELTPIIESLGLPDGPTTVGRVDLCVDFTTDADFSQVQDKDWVSRACTINRYTDKRRFSGFSVGLGGAISARLYDKTLEIEKSKKDFFKPLWIRSGWDGVSPVWRLEFQFRREVLRQLNIKTFDELNDALGGLWEYATHKWLRLCCPNDDQTQSRWPLHPVWPALQQADWFVRNPVCRQDIDKTRSPSPETLFINGLSSLTSFMAIHGVDDISEGVDGYIRAARVYHNAKFDFTGLRFEQYVEGKVTQKRRRFNTGKNKPFDGGPDPANAAVAREYRKQSDGS
ncbi:MAG: replication initiation factor, partial [Gammaproteobacteria bacterium]|nr:replication initiation factor [Gammaproteobacteria bacterium]